MRDRGSALMTTVVAVMVLLLISGVIFSLVMVQTKTETSEEKSLKAYYLAEAGVQYGIAKVLNENIKDVDSLPAEDETVNDPFGEGGNFTVHWQGGESGDTFIVTSTANYFGVTRKKAAESLFAGGGGGGGSDECADAPLPDYPVWNSNQSYAANSYVIYDDGVHKGAFYARYYASAGQIPGVLGNPWQEITKQWRNFNVYNTDDIVCYNSQKFQARNYSYNQQPGLLSSPWQELTDQWRNFNEYVAGSIVIYDGKQFQARNWSKNELPGLISSPWQELTDEWRSFNVYYAGDEVIYNGHRYRAKYYSQNAQPDISNKWELIS